VDLEARLLERWLPDTDRPYIHMESVTWSVSDAPPLALALPPLFVDALGDP
jgi:hypothetical protein